MEVDGAEGAVHLEVGGGVDEGVLAAELFLDVAEAYGYVLYLHWEEGAPTGGVGDFFEDLVAFVFAGADVGADGVDDGLGALALLDGVAHAGAAVVVVTVGDENEGAADGDFVAEGKHLLVAGLVESVEQGGAAAGAEFADALIEEVDVVGEGLGDVGLDIEALNEGAVVDVQHLEEEFDGGVLLELEALADRAGSVEHDADAEGEIGLLLEVLYGCGWGAVIEQTEVFAMEAGDEAAFLIGDGEDEIDFVDLDFDGRDRLFELRGSVGGRR